MPTQVNEPVRSELEEIQIQTNQVQNEVNINTHEMI